MSTIATQLDSILATRAARLRTLDADIAGWKACTDEVVRTLAVVEAAERANPDLTGASAALRAVSEKFIPLLENGAKVRARFARNSLCIGIGGAARMGKSTFLQSVTGLEETQIPTSDKFFTTAVRSQIVNSDDNIAVADFHSPDSFLRLVVAPMCKAVGAQTPTNLEAFRTARFEIPQGRRVTQDDQDVLQRLRDAQAQLATYEKHLTGERGRRIPLEELRPFVAYPEGGVIKAGPFLAVADLVIRVPFPSTDVARLRVVDLPGLGEAGRDLAAVQTAGMADICDVTFLVKRPTDANIEWTLTDTNALDAMGDAVPLLSDQTKYTAILANVGGCDSERARLCTETVRAKLAPRPFEIIKCDARDRKAVIGETMPRILDFLAKNLPEIDDTLYARLKADGDATLAAAKRDIEAVASRVRATAPAGTGDIDFARNLTNAVVGVLVERESDAKDKAVGNDKEWDDEVTRIHEAVAEWVKNGCGYESRDALLAEISREIKKRNAQPSDVINECRVKFRNEWEAMDLHLSNRIASLLAGVMDALKGVLHDFVPRRQDDTIESVRAQIVAFADRIDARHSDLGDEDALRELSRPLRRIAEFDLQFRFHLEPMLHATTHLLVANELPLVKGYEDAAKFHEALEKKLLEAADAYSSGMRKSGTGNFAALDRKKKLFEKAIPDASVRADVIALLEQSMGSAQSFCPNRIFAAVVETFADAFIRSKNSDKAFQILAREWRNELTPAPDEKTRLTNAAAGAVTALVKAF